VGLPVGESCRLADLLGQWIDKAHQRRPPTRIVLDMDSSESPTYGAEVAAPRQMFQEIPSLIARLRAPPASA
jgi:hypothetical protein